VAQLNSDDLTVRQLRLMADEVRDKFFYDAETLAVQMNKINPVGTVKGSGVYWTFRPPGTAESTNLGTHLAWGDTPRVALPTSGTAIYNFVGGTTPTDNMGRTGVLSAGRLGMDFQTRQVTSMDPIAMGFAKTANASAVAYAIPTGSTWSMTSGNQTLANVRCVGCNGTPTATLTGRIVGTTGVGYAAGLTVQSTLGTPATTHIGAAALGFSR
jgi:hypothetical protein